jgi:hypothetical protein
MIEVIVWVTLPDTLRDRLVDSSTEIGDSEISDDDDNNDADDADAGDDDDEELSSDVTDMLPIVMNVETVVDATLPVEVSIDNPPVALITRLTAVQSGDTAPRKYAMTLCVSPSRGRV